VNSNARKLSKPEYVKAANAICAHALFQSRAVKAPAASDPLDKWAKYLAQLLPISVRELTELEKISPPAKDKASIDALLQRIDGANAATESARKAAASNSATRFESALKTLKTYTDQAKQISVPYGLVACATAG